MGMLGLELHVNFLEAKLESCLHGKLYPPSHSKAPNDVCSAVVEILISARAAVPPGSMSCLFHPLPVSGHRVDLSLLGGGRGGATMAPRVAPQPRSLRLHCAAALSFSFPICQVYF